MTEPPLVHHEAPGRSLVSLRHPEEALLEILTCGSGEEARRLWEGRRAMASFLSLNQDPSLLTPIEVKQEGRVVRVLYPPAEGIHLLRYQSEILRGYPVPEDFAWELGFQLSGALRVFLMPGAAALALQPPRVEEIFLTPEGRLRLVPPLAERLDSPGKGSQVALLQGIGEILFALLTLEVPEAGKISRPRDFNRDLSPGGEALLKRLAEGSFGGLLALRSSLADCYASLTGAGPLRDGPLRNFRRNKVEISYAEEIEKAVASEEDHLEALRHPDFGRDYRLLTRLFGGPGLQTNLRRLWWILGLSYLAVLVPLLGARLDLGSTLALWGVISGVWGSFACLVYFGYRRRRGVP